MKKEKWGYLSLVITLFLILILFNVPDFAQAKSYPERPIRVIISSSPGGGLDTTARQLQPFLEKELGTNLIMENHKGGSTAVGNTLVAKGKADGYMFLCAPTPHMQFTIITQNVQYTINDLIPICRITSDPGVIRVRDDAPWKNMKEFIEYAKSQPPETLRGSISYRTSANFIGLKLIEEATGAKFNIVPFGGGQEARVAVLGGHVDFTHACAFNSLNIDKGSRVIGVQWYENYVPEITDNAKTMNEELGTNIPDVAATYGFYVRSEVKERYPARYKRLVEACKKAIENPEYIARLKKLGEHKKIRYSAPDQFHKLNKDLMQTLLKYNRFFK